MTIRKFFTNSPFIPKFGPSAPKQRANEPILDHLIYILSSIAPLLVLANMQNWLMRLNLVTSLKGVHHDMCEIWVVGHVIGILQ